MNDRAPSLLQVGASGFVFGQVCKGELFYTKPPFLAGYYVARDTCG